MILQLLAACVAIIWQNNNLHVALCCVTADVPTKNPSYVHLCRYHCVCCSVAAGHKETTALQLGFDELSGTCHSSWSIFTNSMCYLASRTCLSFGPSFAIASLQLLNLNCHLRKHLLPTLTCFEQAVKMYHTCMIKHSALNLLFLSMSVFGIRITVT